MTETKKRPLVHWERTATLVVSLEIASESNVRPASTMLMAIVGGGDSGRPFTFRNLEALGKFSGIKRPAVTAWLTEMSHWIRQSKVPKNDLWDVVATRMSGVALT